MSPSRNSKRTSRRGYWPDNRPRSHSASPGFYNLRMPQRLDMTAHIRMSRRSPGNHAIVLFCLLSILFFPRFLAAAEWSLAPVITLGAGADDNPALTTGPSETKSFLFLSPRINWIRKTEISSVNLGMSLNATRYSGDDVEDTYSHVLSLASFFQTSERTRWGLDGRLRRDTLFRTIRTTPDTGDLEDTDDVLVEQKVRRTWLSARPTWKYALSERSSLGMNYRITDVSFSNTEATGLVDYQNHSLSTQYSRRITDRNDLNLVVNRLAYRPDGTGTKSDTTQLLVGVSHAYSETSRGRFQVGSGKTRQTTAAVTEDTTGVVMEAGLELRSELTTFDGVISRDVQASGIGRSMMSNQLRMYLARKISPMTSFVFRAKLFRNKALEGSDPGVDRRFYELVPGLSWQWRPEWAFGTEYRYRSKKFDVNPETAESNMLFMSATYVWPRQVASR